MARELRIRINGVEYDSLDEVPEPLRSMFVDHDGDGIPDDITIPDGNMDIGIDREWIWGGEIGSLPIELMAAVRSSGFGHVSRHDARTLRGASDDRDYACASCAYDLRGSVVSGNCPECGTPVTLALRRVRHEITPRVTSPTIGQLFRIRPRTLALLMYVAIFIGLIWAVRSLILSIPTAFP